MAKLRKYADWFSIVFFSFGGHFLMSKRKYANVTYKMMIKFSKIRATLALFFSLTCSTIYSQIVKLSPANVSASDSVEVIFDATQGTKGLVGATTVYMHSGVITSSTTGTDWQNVQGNWGKDDGIGKMTKLPNEADKWSIKLKPSIRDYYKVANGTTVFRLSMVFRNADGSREGKGTAGAFSGGSVAANGDIFLDLNVGNFVQIKSPIETSIFTTKNKSISFEAEASIVADSISFYIDRGIGYTFLFGNAASKNLVYNYLPPKTENIKLKVVAKFGSQKVEQIKEYSIVLKTESTIKPLPFGLKKGINYSSDFSKATLVLEAPQKEFVYVVGDLTNWEINDAFLMNKTPDGELYWLEIGNLTPSKEYVFQYWVDGSIKIGDPYADKVADPWNDKFIPASVYPNLPNYTKTENEIASVLQTGQPAFSWKNTESTWKRPDKNSLIIYELLVRDFIGSHSYKDLTDTLSYLKRLGVNAIELMPIMEFEGNESWGYNPSYFLAPDKYYGTKNELKNFIQVAHSQGFAVVLDMVLNHAFGQNAMVKMYFKDGKPTAENPWFNVDATHPFNVGYDFNHESKYTQAFVDSVNTYWLKEYHFDGFRFDLSKGFTQRNNASDVDEWSKKDDSRIALLKRMAGKIKQVDKDAYIILEHFAEAAEETELKAEGMMVWGNSTYDYGDLLINKNANINAAKELNRVSYMESHDEERLMVKALNSTTKSTAYSVDNELVALNRIKLLAAFFYTLPGAKMMWQFQELGYDKSINFNDRVGNKPLPWGLNSLKLYENAERQKLYKTHAEIINLVKNNPKTFTEKSVSTNFNNLVKTIKADGDELDVAIIGNFELTQKIGNIEFTHNGTWYNFFGNDSMNVINLSTPVTLQPGEFKFYTDKKIKNNNANLVTTFEPIVVSNPANFTPSSDVTLTFKAIYANKLNTEGLVNATDVYMVAGIVTTSSNDTILTKKVNEVSAKTKLTKVTGKTDEWEIKLNPRTFFGVTESENIFRIGMYFQDLEGKRLGKEYDGGNIFLNLQSDGKLVTVSPAEFSPETQITITFDAAVADANGTAGLIGAEKVYMHAGIITDGETATNWKYVVGNWGKDDGVGTMTKVAGSTTKYQITLTPKIYFSTVPPGSKWNRIGMVFRSPNGTSEGKASGGKDIFVNFSTQIVTPQTPLTNEEEPLEKLTLVFPNPSFDNIKISTDKQIQNVTLYTLSGSKLASLSFTKDVAFESYLVDMQGIRNGNYLLLIEHKHGMITKRIIVEN